MNMTQSDVVLSREGRLGRILLNRPKALNALNHGMSLAIEAALREWSEDKEVAAIVIRQAGERAFCAGGDVRQFTEKGPAFMRQYWRDEYRLNALIRHYPKPYIALVDGIVMGGGVGVSAHGSHRIVSEHVAFAMPETAIGLVPDVGASYLLPRMPGEIGLYLGLTGARLGAADSVAVGFGTHHVKRAGLDALEAGLAHGGDPIERVIGHHAQDPGPAPILEQRAEIDRHFGQPSLGAVMASLAADPGAFAQSVLATLSTRSPTSMALTFRLLREGRRQAFEDCIRREWGIVSRMDEHSDFAEGVRALLVDKDNRPRWNPPHLDQVREDVITRYFEPAEGPPLDLG
ncbi:MAG TPA: enoyl-CoA hydratase/isomerase family protein [Hypericibacter adhaerens]|uniref:3-hydroxyisobutyryl-CoA hydrolase n=1 Tax=Hypericibacter adhaerens TaxID=2602016 RepID=A0A5J6N7H9_9PROT|nr:enoyl-CoA hydratase/isomerase family protein [Hypericibacter adhaerens]QEX23046.1 enoyl-CoA hydratase [Hypericibacter adhaerens]HWA44223.1 enoyl-CoA hydratase/isomerase family protein [Hypericibacter adhaerens]